MLNNGKTAYVYNVQLQRDVLFAGVYQFWIEHVGVRAARVCTAAGARVSGCVGVGVPV